MGRARNSTPAAVASRHTVPVSTKIFRAGTIEKVSDYGSAHESFLAADSCVPEGRVGRLVGLFCGPELTDLAQWVKSNAMCGSDYSVDPQEIHYRGPEPYIYPADAWLAASNQFDRCQRTDERIKQIFAEEYWNKGILLSEYRAREEELSQQHIWRGKGEILIDPQYVTSNRRVSRNRLLSVIDPDNISDISQIKHAFKQLNSF